MMEQSIRELVERAKMGDQQAIAALYEKTSRKAYYLSLQLVKDQDQAQDILQDAFLKVFTNLNMLQQPENFQGWLDTIVINKSKDYLKKKKPVLFSQMTGSEEPDSEPDFEDERGYFSPEKQVDYQETKRLVQEMIDRLPEEQRMAVVLYYLENLSVGQIARLMECSEGTIKSRLNYGRKSIKAQVLALEKKGTKLYCMPLVPFLYWMFRQQILAAAAPKAVGAAVLQAAGAGAAAAGAGNAAGISAGTGAGGGIAGTTASGGTATGAGTAGGTAAAGTVLLGQLPRELEPPGQLPPPEPELLPSPREPPEKPVLRFLARPLASKALPLWRQPAWAWEPERRAAYTCIKTTRRPRLQRPRRNKARRKRKRRKMPEAGKTKMRERRMERWGAPGCPQRSAKFCAASTKRRSSGIIRRWQKRFSRNLPHCTIWNKSIFRDNI